MPLLVQWTNAGLISAISFIMLFSSVASILVGCLLMQLGKPIRLAFVLHIAFSAMACLTTHFIFIYPLALGISVAVTALIWPVSKDTDRVRTDISSV